jgi:hypothetical protein
MTTNSIDWSDVEQAARQMAGNWKQFAAFVWGRGYCLEDADRWMIGYTSQRDAGLLAQSNHQVITERLAPFCDGADPDLVFERHYHFAFRHVEGFSIRVYGADGTITDAFRAFCCIQKHRLNRGIQVRSETCQLSRQENQVRSAPHFGRRRQPDVFIKDIRRQSSAQDEPPSRLGGRFLVCFFSRLHQFMQQQAIPRLEGLGHRPRPDRRSEEGAKLYDRISVTLRFDRDVWEQFLALEDDGTIDDRTAIINGWFREKMADLDPGEDRR